MKEEQIKEFWQGLGFKYRKRTESEPFWKDGMVWVEPNGSIHYRHPPIDLNNLFKYAVPKIIKEFGANKTFEIIFLTWFQWIVLYPEDTANELFKIIDTVRKTLP